jgi:hypothetical protein
MTLPYPSLAGLRFSSFRVYFELLTVDVLYAGKDGDLQVGHQQLTLILRLSP